VSTGNPVRVIETPVFLYADLPTERAKERARDWYLEGDSFGWHSEYRESLAAFVLAFPVKVRGWEVDAWRCAAWSSFTGDEAVGNLTGARLAAYLWNNYKAVLTERVVYRLASGRKRVSRIALRERDCPFTGTSMDESLLAPIRGFMRRPVEGVMFSGLLEGCIEEWAKEYSADLRYHESEEAVAESMEANEYTFTADGRRFG
jgi:hypothetical protein